MALARLLQFSYDSRVLAFLIVSFFKSHMWVRFSYYGHGYIDSRVLANIMTKSSQCFWKCFQDTQDADSVQWFAQILGWFIMYISTPTIRNWWSLWVVMAAPHCYSFVMKLMMVLHFVSNSSKVMNCTLIVVLPSKSPLLTILHNKFSILGFRVQVSLRLSLFGLQSCSLYLKLKVSFVVKMEKFTICFH
jgi:hypothetical protein